MMTSVQARPNPQSGADRPRRYAATVDLAHSPEELWPYLSNTDEVNRRLGLPKVDYAFEPLETGGAKMRARIKLTGFQWEYEERPYEWVAPRYLSVERFYSRGLFRYFKFNLHLEPREGGGTRATLAFDIVPRFALLPLGPVLRKQVSDFVRLYRVIDGRIGKSAATGAPGFETVGPESRPRETEAVRRRIQELRESWAHLTSVRELPGRLASYVHLAPEFSVRRMRPKVLAGIVGAPVDEVLRFCLQATRAGFLSFNWSVLCPGCRGPKLQAATLDGLAGEAHCESCNIRYDASFDRNVEVTFRPAEKVRRLGVGEFCFGSPSNTSQYRVQYPLGPGEARRVSFELEPGAYRLRSPSASNEIAFRVDPRGTAPSPAVRVDGELHAAFGETVGTRLELEIANALDAPTALRVERLREREEALTAHELTALQDFRDLFSSQVLRPGAEIAISNAVLMFTDLKDSTAMYERQGDAPAFALVQDHFDVMFRIIREHRGSVVKTIGDAVMAVFTTVDGGVRASAAILEAFREWNARHPGERHVLVKIGLHQGPCIIITQNDKLDYFGSTVNRAARVQGAAGAEELVLSEEVFMDLAAQRALKEIGEGIRVEKFRAELKGIDSRMHLFRVRLAPRLPQRLPGAPISTPGSRSQRR